MPPDGIDHAKSQIAFFMEKSFQVSFGYITALVALIAAAKLDVMSGLADKLTTSSAVLVALAILLLNTVYLSIGAACVFAILKRGLFLLTCAEHSDDQRGSQVEWEIFVRRPPRPLYRRSVVSKLAWNVDNYYMVPVYVYIFAISGGAFAYGWAADSSMLARGSLVVIFCLHVIPVSALLATARLNRVCRDRITER